LIAGAELGGVALAAATAMETGKSWVIIRSKKKGYGTDKLIEGVLKTHLYRQPTPPICHSEEGIVLQI